MENKYFDPDYKEEVHTSDVSKSLEELDNWERCENWKNSHPEERKEWEKHSKKINRMMMYSKVLEIAKVAGIVLGGVLLSAGAADDKTKRKTRKEIEKTARKIKKKF